MDVAQFMSCNIDDLNEGIVFLFKFFWQLLSK